MDETLLFHLTGRRTGSLGSADAMRPALLAPFRDLTRLRYEFPVVLVEGTDADPPVRTLSGIVDDLVRAAEGGVAGRTRSRLLRIEREIRSLLAVGGAGALAGLWETAALRVAGLGAESALSDARPAIDGQVVDCDAEMPALLVGHVWRAVTARRCAPVLRRVDELAVRLSDLVRADRSRSIEGRGAAALRAGVGGAHRDLFDFDLMAHLVATPSGASALPPHRTRRIESALVVLRRGRALLAAGGPVFESARAALASQRERLPRMAELVRAIAVAELEVEGRYVESEHDPYVAAFDGDALGPSELALFPGPLVRLAPRADGARAEVLEALLGGAPITVLAETDDALGADAQLAMAATGIDGAFVVQAPGSHLRAAVPALVAAMEHRGPALISVFTGAGGAARPYLVAAAACESRAFPAFAWDPSSRRLSLTAVPQPDRAWPVHALRYADRSLQRVTEEVAFTSADMALLDPRRADRFARVAADGADGLVPVAERLGGDAGTMAGVPYVYAVDGEDRLCRLVVDARMVAVARRHAETWERMRDLARPPETVPAAPRTEDAAGPAVAPAAAAVAEAAPREAPPSRSADEPYIDTARCSTCNECTAINARMFAYNADRQAYIADASAGTYRELVEAAESCQVAIIHPGAPRDPSEPGLDELIERAAAFR